MIARLSDTNYLSKLPDILTTSCRTASENENEEEEEEEEDEEPA